MAEPSAESKTLKNLTAGTPLKLTGRQGFWVMVDASGGTGWLKVSVVTMGSGVSTGLGALDTGRAGRNNIVSTSAARGLSAKDMLAARPDFSQFELLQKLTVGSAEAQNFAQFSGLKGRQLALLGAPSQSAAPAMPRGSGQKSKPSADADDDKDDDDGND